MSITFDSIHKSFHLQTDVSSYILKIFDQGTLAPIYFGKRIHSLEGYLLYSSSNYSPSDLRVNLDIIPNDYPAYGHGDFRTPAFKVQKEDGSTVSKLKYVSYSIYSGKPALKGLPSTYVEQDDEAETLEITLADHITGLQVLLSYSVFTKHNAITRSARLVNTRVDETLKLLRAMSMSIDFDHSNFDFLQLSGAWCREKHIHRRPLFPGIQAVDSKRGMSSAQQSPFIALVDKNTDEDTGSVYGFDLVYSGNFLAQAEVDSFGSTRLSLGINPFDFSWLLPPGTSFQTPEVVMVYSPNGLGQMSRTYHNLYRSRLCRGTYRDQLRPIPINNWQATYFDFTADKLECIADVAKDVGIELFVLDDGWFGHRDSDNSSLGDWVVDYRKLPNGLADLANKIRSRGLEFGLWFEPEMVSPDSDLYRVHPDWCVHVSGCTPAQGPHQRNQLVLDLTREDVRQEIVHMVSNILECAPISYVKWDMNRPICDMGSTQLSRQQQLEFAHRYILGLYEIMDTLTTRFPHILFESCASGGARYDSGILYYMPQTWTSDDTDAIERLKIQYGTSLVYPAITMGSHISSCPNHQVGRNTSLTIRGHVAMSGRFGYELDLTALSDGEIAIVKEQVTEYKNIRHIIQKGDFYRLINPFENNDASWMFISPDQTEVIVYYFKVLAEPHVTSKRLKLKGLIPNARYSIIGTDLTCSGEELMYFGLDTTKLEGDFASISWHLIRL